MKNLDLTVVPDEDEPGAAAVMVDGSIGPQPYRFLLDTGAATTTVVFDEVTANFPVTGKKDSSGVFGKSSDDLIKVPMLTVGPISNRDIQIARLPPGAKARGNLLGMDVLKDACWHFDFAAGVASRITVSESGQERRWEELEMDDKSHPHVRVRLERETFAAVWDTGAGVTVVDASLQEMHPECFRPAGSSSGTDSSGETMETDMWWLQGLTLGGRTFPPHKVASVDLTHVNAQIKRPMHLALGFTTLILSEWWMDFSGMRWCLGRLSNPQVSPPVPKM
jgi:predicted aspartyl protease